MFVTLCLDAVTLCLDAFADPFLRSFLTPLPSLCNQFHFLLRFLERTKPIGH